MKTHLLAFAAWLSGGAAFFAAESNVVLDWNALMLDAIRADDSSPTLSTRNLAILHTAVYDAVNSVLRTHQPYKFQEDAPPGTSAEAAAVGAAYEVMRGLYPPFESLEDYLYQKWIGNAPANAATTNGLALGELIAQLTLEDRSDDGASTDVPYIPSEAPGQWRRTPPFFRPPLTPQWRYVTPFCLPELESYMPPPPPALDSPEYAEALNEVKAIGGQTSNVRTPYQTETAVFWSDFSYTATPAGHWDDIAARIAADRKNTLAESARLFALLTMAQTDAGIVCWEAKYRYNFWRPITAIQRADEDNNPLTDADKSWNHLLIAPAFPAYMSGHSTFSKASAQVLTHFYGSDAIDFTSASDSLPGVVRSYHNLATCADECGMSRIYGGIHFIFENVYGKSSGKKVGDFVANNFLLPNDQLPLLRFEGFANGKALIRVHAHAGQICALEVSNDLVKWQQLSNSIGVSGGTTAIDEFSGESKMRFYRAVER